MKQPPHAKRKSTIIQRLFTCVLLISWKVDCCTEHWIQKFCHLCFSHFVAIRATLFPSKSCRAGPTFPFADASNFARKLSNALIKLMFWFRLLQDLCRHRCLLLYGQWSQPLWKYGFCRAPCVWHIRSRITRKGQRNVSLHVGRQSRWSKHNQAARQSVHTWDAMPTSSALALEGKR